MKHFKPALSRWHSAPLREMHGEIEAMMRRYPDDSDAANALFHAQQAIEEADFAISQRRDAA